MSGHYDKEGNPLGLFDWAKLMEDSDYKRVAFDKVADVEVSTVWLGLDHGFGGKPLIFETMVFGGERDQETRRYSTLEEAKAGHAAIVAELSAETN